MFLMQEPKKEDFMVEEHYIKIMANIKEIKRIKEELEIGGLDGLSHNWNNLSYAINQLVLKAGISEQDAGKTEQKKFIRPMLGRISAPFGETRTNSKGQTYYHSGIDIADNPAIKRPILAAANGVVISYGDAKDGYGLKLIIDHGNGFRTLYAHCSVLQVKSGDKVKLGQQIAIVGSTGHSTGPHLHFEIIKNGIQVDPEVYID